jgi:tight adherence protein B
MSVRRLITGVATAGFLLVAVAGPAIAAPTSTIEQVKVSNGELSVVVALSDVPAGADVDTRNVTASLQGQTLDPSVESASDAGSLRQTTYLVMDTSDSMNQDDKLQGAKDAARQFVDAVPSDVEIGLITFDDVARLQVEPTTDRGSLVDTIDSLTTAPQTVLYDAVTLTSDKLKSADVGSALLLSDGADRGSTVTLAQATKAAKSSGARFDVVSFGESSAQNTALSDIAGSTGGTVYQAADTAELIDAFDSAASTITNRYVVTAPIPEGYTQHSGTVSVTIPVDGAPVSDQAFVALSPADLPKPGEIEPQPAPEPGPLASISQNLIWVAIVGVGIALLVLVFFAISASTDPERGQRSGVRRRLSIYTLGGSQPVKEQETTVLGDTQVARSAVEFAGKVVAQRDFESLLGGKLESAAIPLKPAEWLLIHTGIVLGAGLVLFLVSSGRVFVTLIGLFLGFLVPWLYLSYKATQRRKAFMGALPDTLQLMAGSLSAGYSMPQAVDTVVREGKGPISTEFNRALVEARLGVELEDALDGIAERMQSVDFAWVVMAIRIQREVGGNLAEVLSTVSATLRERERLRRQVQVLSAEGRLSAWILGLLPVVFALYLVLVRPTYLAPLLDSVFGWMMIAIGLLLMVVGGFWLRKVVKVEV